MTGNGLKLSHSYGNMIWAPEQPNPVHPSMAIYITHVLIMDCASKTHCENDPEVNSTTSESQGQGCCLIAKIEIDLHLEIKNKKLLGQYYDSIYTTWPRQLSAEIGLPCCPGMQQHCSSLSDLLMNWAMNAIPLYQCTWIPWQQKEFACLAIPGDCGTKKATGPEDRLCPSRTHRLFSSASLPWRFTASPASRLALPVGRTERVAEPARARKNKWLQRTTLIATGIATV